MNLQPRLCIFNPSQVAALKIMNHPPENIKRQYERDGRPSMVVTIATKWHDDCSGSPDDYNQGRNHTPPEKI
jgi:hypothetical protein